MIKRKVRKDFNRAKPISVDVRGRSKDTKEKVQQAFFDVGIKWGFSGDEYDMLGKDVYTNMSSNGRVESSLMWVSHYSSNHDNRITPEQFFAMVYEDEQQEGHPHAELMMQYAEDAKTHKEPWKLWQAKDKYMDNVWFNLDGDPVWHDFLSFRRKPKTHLVHGVEVPDLRIEPRINDRYYVVDLYKRECFSMYVSNDDNLDYLLAERGLCYEYTEVGKQAAILHAKAMLGISYVRHCRFVKNNS